MNLETTSANRFVHIYADPGHLPRFGHDILVLLWLGGFSVIGRIGVAEIQYYITLPTREWIASSTGLLGEDEEPGILP